VTDYPVPGVEISPGDLVRLCDDPDREHMTSLDEYLSGAVCIVLDVREGPIHKCPIITVQIVGQEDLGLISLDPREVELIS